MIKKMLCVTLCFSFTLLEAMEIKYENDEIAAHCINNKAALYLENRFPMKVCGSGIGGIKEIDFLSLSFNSEERWTEKQALKVAVDCTNEYVRELNKDKIALNVIRPSQFMIENLGISIYFPEPMYEDKIGLLCGVSVIKGLVRLRAWKSEICSETIKEISFEEAERLVSEEAAEGGGRIQ